MQNLIASKPQKLKIDKPDDYFFSTDHHMPSQRYDVEGDDHIMTRIDTPMRSDAFDKTDDQKISEIEQHFAQIMDILGLDRSDDSLKGTPYRVAKMYVKEIFSGLNPANKPDVKLFDNKYKYNEMLVEKDITFYSNCEYHFVPIIGKAHIANISGGKVIGLSKLNRIVQYYAKRPQVQERLTIQIAEEIKKAVQSDDVAVVIEATHLCVSSRGVQDITSSTVTSSYSGKFMDESKKSEFLKYI
jgi:GTP cyclohydrolase I